MIKHLLSDLRDKRFIQKPLCRTRNRIGPAETNKERSCGFSLELISSLKVDIKKMKMMMMMHKQTHGGCNLKAIEEAMRGKTVI